MKVAVGAHGWSAAASPFCAARHLEFQALCLSGNKSRKEVLMLALLNITEVSILKGKHVIEHLFRCLHFIHSLICEQCLQGDFTGAS